MGCRVPGGQASFNLEPNAFLVETTKRLEPGSALDVGMGQGRNAIFLAQHGWDVTGFDVSEVGVNQAREQARKAGVALKAVIHVVQYEEPRARADWGLFETRLVRLLAQKPR